MMKLYPVTLLTFLVLALTPSSSSSHAFPIVDLGYARHVPTFMNTTAKYNITYATYGNIHFAQSPVSDLRFRAPVTPPPAVDGIQDGVVSGDGTVCLQTIPSRLTNPPGLNGTTLGGEDCLFLDVIVPEGLLPTTASTGVPVFHWIYGGGFIFGAKDIGPNPATLLDGMSPDKKFIVVASNYLLGAFLVDEF
jgi:carboxylesterase type B